MPDMAIRIEELRPAAEGAWANVGPSAAEIANKYRLSNLALSEAIGVANSTLANYLKGRVAVPGWLADVLATILGVPLDVLKMEPDAALKWVLDNPSETRQPLLNKGCCDESAAIAA